ncbi:regulatory protein RecX [Fangia hongkongensis]|uniref:regulatory protein RecX n=1 Tax=Fangia hongkongensis TaxID=270495 RepID=UPI000A06A405|nr:regulatory protein RecX [Fangia hongkongensis]MBK2124688.1 regulatory protein RecX [Fangia hongkongensis]
MVQMLQAERNYLFFLLSKKEYSRFELKSKLKARNKLSHDEIEALLTEFSDQNWQSDRRLTEMLVASYLNKHYGKGRIIQKLVYEKQVDKVIVESVLSEQAIDWFHQASQCYENKYHSDIKDIKDKQKRIQYLLRQGHDYTTAVEVVGNIQL